MEPDLDVPDADGHMNENIYLSIKKTVLNGMSAVQLERRV